MSINLGQLEFELRTEPAYLNARLDEILREVNSRLPGSVLAEPVLQKCRWVLTELVTNAYKHANRTDVLLRMLFDAGHISIIKEDTGSPLYFHLPDGSKITWPLGDSYTNTSFDLFCDEANILNVKIEQGGKVFFCTRQNPDTAPQNMNEHFGLIIIASVCNEFTYTYEAYSGKNIFKTVIAY